MKSIRWVVRAGELRTLGALVKRAGGDERAVEEGRVFIGRRRARSRDETLAVGDEVTIAPPRPAKEVVILARDSDLVAVDKPAGSPTIGDQAGSAHALLESTARAIGVDPARLHATSRLDRDVSGVVVFALSTAATARLRRARDQGRYARRYVAIAAGVPEPREGTWDAPIGRTHEPRHRAAFGRDAASAETRYAVAAVAGACALLLVEPKTGRTHQIRVHASHAGVPLLGDSTYGGPARLVLAGGRVLALRRIALHAARVIVPRARGAPLCVVSPVPDDLRELWSSLGGEASALTTSSVSGALSTQPPLA